MLLGQVIALLPIYASDVLQVGPEGLGALRIAIGEVGIGLCLHILPFDRRVGLAMFIAIGVLGFANLVFSLSSLYWLSFTAQVVAGGADMVSVYIRSTLVQFSTPDAMRGRVNAVNMLFIGSSAELVGVVRGGRRGCRRQPVYPGGDRCLDVGLQATAHARPFRRSRVSAERAG